MSLVKVSVTANEWLRRETLKLAISEAVKKDCGDHAIVLDHGYGCLAVTALKTSYYDLVVSIGRARDFARHTAHQPTKGLSL
jgi:hypothetical protein